MQNVKERRGFKTIKSVIGEIRLAIWQDCSCCPADDEYKLQAKLAGVF
jgi:hypothetical protein